MATNLPPGSGANGSVHTYDWTIPDAVTNQGRVRVRMDNAGVDYLDISNADFSIVEPADVNGDGVVDVNDLVLLFVNWGPCPDPPAPCPGDTNDDGAVDVNDLVVVFENWD